MERVLNYIGYSNELKEKDRFIYITALVGSIQLVVFLIFYMTIVKSPLLVIETASITAAYFSIFLMLKHKRFTSGKIVALLGMTVQVAFLVFVWFPERAGLVFFFFIIPPIAFFVFDYEDPTEKKALFVINSIISLLIILSVLIEPKELIKLNEKYMFILCFMTVVSTAISEILVFYFYANSLLKTHRELRFLANIDPLTNISNRRILFEKGNEMIEIYRKYDRTFTLMILDIDFFKSVNDRFGHPAGDSVLKSLSAIISSNICNEDIFCRYGGEEFAVIFKNLDDNHYYIIEKIKDKISNHPFVIDDKTTVNITISAGVITCEGNIKTFDELVQKADKLLYQAKLNGRNRIEFQNQNSIEEDKYCSKELIF